jgi:hypothetical protein
MGCKLRTLHLTFKLIVNGKIDEQASTLVSEISCLFQADDDKSMFTAHMWSPIPIKLDCVNNVTRLYFGRAREWMVIQNITFYSNHFTRTGRKCWSQQITFSELDSARF